MTDKFAKLYETEDRGQILVTLDTNEEGSPAVRFFVSPTGLGVCAIGPSFEDSESGWDAAEDLFERVDLDMAYRVVQPLFDMLQSAEDDDQ